MINIDYEHSITVTFSNTRDAEDLTTFMNILSKCNTEAKKSGFKNMFKGREKEFIKALYSHLTGEVNSSENVYAEKDTIKDKSW